MSTATKITAFGLFLLATSCVINGVSYNLVKFEGGLAGMYSEYDQTREEFPQLFVPSIDSVSSCDWYTSGDSRIFVTNGIDIKECVKTKDQAVVYFWKPRCSSDKCYSLELLQKSCNEAGLTLFIVATYYDGRVISEYQGIVQPIFGIDTEYYDTDRTSKYVSRFVYDLTTVVIDSEPDEQLFYFEDGDFVKSVDYLNEI